MFAFWSQKFQSTWPSSFIVFFFCFPFYNLVEYFGITPPTGITLDAQTAAILEFLENEEITVISAVHDKQEDRIKFNHHIPSDEVCLLFYKIPQFGQSGAGTAGASSTTATSALDNQPLGILTLEGGLVKSIYNSVSRVFSPHANTRVRCAFAFVLCSTYLISLVSLWSYTLVATKLKDVSKTIYQGEKPYNA